MPSVPVVAIGGSAGSLDPLRALFAGLPPDLPAAVLVVVHRPAAYRSYLADILGREGPLRVRDAEDGEEVAAGRAYVAPPDRHLLLRDGRLALSRGPKENHARPSIDVLFRSVAVGAGPRAVGVLLSGGMDDGASGLWALKRLGGVAVVQHPEDALSPEMPLSALRRGEADEIVHDARLAERVTALARRAARAEEATMPDDERDRLRREVEVAAWGAATGADFPGGAVLSPFACPECHGVMAQVREGDALRFRYHTGHAYSARALLAAVREQVEEKLWQAVRALDEDAMLLDHLARHHAEGGREDDTRAFEGEARRVRERARRVREEALRGSGGGLPGPGTTNEEATAP